MERAEYLARVLEATLRLAALPIAYVGSSNEWETAVATAGCRKLFFARYPEANEENVSEFLAFSTDNPSSIRNCIEMARQNARSVRTALTIETWETINGAWLELKRFGNGPTSREEFLRFLHWVQETSLRFDGSAYRTMLRNDVYWFSRLGLYIERADNTARILDTTLRLTALPLTYVGSTNEWESAVATAGCANAFFETYKEANEETVTEFLAFSTANPSSIRNCFESARLNARAVRTALTIEMWDAINTCLLYTSPSPRDGLLSRMPSSA